MKDDQITIERHNKDVENILEILNSWGFITPPPGSYKTIKGIKFIPITHPDGFSFLLQHQSKDELWYYKPGGKREENMELYFKLNQEFLLDQDYVVTLMDVMKDINKVVIYSRRYYKYDTYKKRRTMKPCPMNQKLWFSSPVEQFDYKAFLIDTYYYKTPIKDYKTGKTNVMKRFEMLTHRISLKDMEVQKGVKSKFFVVPIKNDTYKQNYWFDFSKDGFVDSVAEWDFRMNKIMTDVKRVMSEQRTLGNYKRGG